MIAVFVNCAAIIFGSLIGLLFSRKNTEKLTEVVSVASGIITLILGFQMAFKYENIIYLALAVILGGVIGSFFDIDGKILSIGSMLERKFYHAKVIENKKPDFAYAFLNSTVMFCVGAMAILGSFQAGIDKDYSIIFTKSILDGFMSIVFTASMGIGTAFSSIVVFVYQGALTLLSSYVSSYATEQMIAEVTASGGVLIIMIGMNILGLRKIKTANYLPAIILSIVFVLLDMYGLFNCLMFAS